MAKHAIVHGGLTLSEAVNELVLPAFPCFKVVKKLNLIRSWVSSSGARWISEKSENFTGWQLLPELHLSIGSENQSFRVCDNIPHSLNY